MKRFLHNNSASVRMKYGSVCSGIEAATVAWQPLGWQAVFFSEIDPFACALLSHYYSCIPNFGDVTKFREWPDAAIDVLVGGTPCQSFSVAGLRKGLADPRGNIALTYLAIAARYRPRWVVWENVAGVLSSGCGRDFASFLGGLGELGYGWAYRVLDAQYFGVPQRRRRVFVIGHLGTWRVAAAVLFERESLRRDPPPSRTAGKTAPTLPSRSSAGGGLGTDFDCDGGLIARCITTREGFRQDFETETLIAHALRAEGFDASEDGTGRGTPLIPAVAPLSAGNNVTSNMVGRRREDDYKLAFDTTQITHPANRSRPDDRSPQLSATAHPPTVAIQAGALRQNPNSGPDGAGTSIELAYTLEARAEVQAVALNLRGREGGSQLEPDGLASLRASSGGSSRSYVAQAAVRRLTPRECERLQGFPDDYTLIPYRGKPSADGPRYKALGNSMAVPVMRWIGERIALVESVLNEIEERAA